MPNNGRRRRLRDVLTMLDGIVAPWRLECDLCAEEYGARKPGGIGRKFIRREASDDAARAAGWRVEISDDEEIVICTACQLKERAA